MVNTNDKKREWLENISDIRKKKEQELKELEEKKKKELEELEQKKKEELKEADERLKASIEEISNEEEQLSEQLKEKIPEVKELEPENLEETIAQEKISKEVTKESGPIYQVPIEEKVNQIYQQSNYNVYNELNATLDKIKAGEYLTKEERNVVYKRQEEINRLEQNKEFQADPLFLKDKDPYGYIDRSKQVINSIEKSLHSTYKTGGDHI